MSLSKAIFAIGLLWSACGCTFYETRYRVVNGTDHVIVATLKERWMGNVKLASERKIRPKSAATLGVGNWLSISDRRQMAHFVLPGYYQSLPDVRGQSRVELFYSGPSVPIRPSPPIKLEKQGAVRFLPPVLVPVAEDDFEIAHRGLQKQIGEMINRYLTQRERRK